MNAYIKFGENMSSSSQDIERKQNFVVNQGPQLRYNLLKIMCNNPKLDIDKINAYIKFGENVSSSSQDIERNRNFGLNQVP